MSFSDLGLSPETLKAVEDSGYTEPTPIQAQAIPYVLMGRDVLGIAQTGTGKTAGFTLPMIDILAHGKAKARMPRSLILAPTRELANQVAENFVKYGKYQKLNMALLIGGESMNEQKKVLEKGVDVLIATPGRLLDLFDRGNILLRDVKILVIDEADRMLDMGFIPDVERIVSLLPPLRQTLFFSATMDKQIQRLADAFLQNPKEVRVAAPKSSAETVTQKMVVVDEMDKREALRHILRMEDVRNAFIFCNRKRDVGVLYKSLTKHGFDAAQLHGDMPQSERTATLARFKAGEVKLLVCSDVAARGIDIADVSHVFNFDVPIHSEDYVHRIGRTGRAGREGKAYTIATPAEFKHVAAVENQIGKVIERLDLEGIETQELSEEAAKAARRRGRAAPAKGRGGRPERGDRGDRGDRRDRRREETPAPREEAAIAQAEAPVSAPAKEERPEPRADRPERPERSERTPDRGADRSRGGKSQRGRGRRGHPAWDVDEMQHADDVLAFGDHTPAFLLISTADAAIGSGLSDEAEAEAERVDEEVTEALGTAEPAETAGDKPKRRRSRRRKPAAAKAEEAASETPPATEEASAEPAPAAEAPAEPEEPSEAAVATEEPAPPKKRPTRRRAKKAEPEPAADAATDQAAPTEDAAPTEEAAPSEEAPKKRAPRRRTAKAAATDASEAPADAEAKPAPKKRAPRKTAAQKAAEAAAEAPTEGVPGAETGSEGEAGAEAPAEKPKRKPAARKTAAKKAPAKKAPAKKTTTRRKKADAEPAPDAEAAAAEAGQPAPPPDGDQA